MSRLVLSGDSEGRIHPSWHGHALPGIALLADAQYMEPAAAKATARMVAAWWRMPRDEFLAASEQL